MIIAVSMTTIVISIIISRESIWEYYSNVVESIVIIILESTWEYYYYITREVAAENIGIPRVGLLRWLDRSNAALATLWVHKITFM